MDKPLKVFPLDVKVREQIFKDIIQTEIDTNWGDTSFIWDMLAGGFNHRGYNAYSDQELYELAEEIGLF